MCALGNRIIFVDSQRKTLPLLLGKQHFFYIFAWGCPACLRWEENLVGSGVVSDVGSALRMQESSWRRWSKWEGDSVISQREGDYSFLSIWDAQHSSSQEWDYCDTPTLWTEQRWKDEVPRRVGQCCLSSSIDRKVVHESLRWGTVARVGTNGESPKKEKVRKEQSRRF